MASAFDRQDEPEQRSAGPSKAALRNMLRQAVVNTGGKVTAADTPSHRSVVSQFQTEITTHRSSRTEPEPSAPVHAEQPKKPAAVSTGDARPVKPIALPPNMRAAEIDCEAPEARMVDPCSLLIERAYQRDISEKSIKLIRKIITHWDWAKFKPPICAETASGLFVVDGQHTAIAAASHPAIKQIPVMIVAADLVEKRAESFVSHNRDRLIMTAAQVFHGEVAAGRAGTRELLGVVERAGGSIPRLPIAKGYAKTGQITAVNELRKIYGACGAEVVERIVRIAVLSKLAPISATILIGLRIVLTEGHFAETAKLPDRQLAAGLGSIENIEATSQHFAAESGQSRYRACAALIAAAIKKAPK